MATATGKLLTQDEKNLCEIIANLNIRLISQRAKALLFIDQGHTQAKSAELSSLSIGQLRYLLVLFKEKGINLFPAHLLPQKEAAAPLAKEAEEVKEISEPEIKVPVPVEAKEVKEVSATEVKKISSKKKKKVKKKKDKKLEDKPSKPKKKQKKKKKKGKKSDKKNSSKPKKKSKKPINKPRKESTSDSKNIPKNYGKEIIKFVHDEKEIIERMLS